MNSKLCVVVATASLVLGVSVAGADSVGGCGWGSKVFDGQRGLAPQVLAVTTNGVFGNQTFGISSNTAGCSRDGVIRSNWRTAAYIEQNRDALAADISRGQGESLETLATLLGMSEVEKQLFSELAKQNFDTIYSHKDITTEGMRASLRETLKSSERLARFAGAV